MNDVLEFVAVSPELAHLSQKRFGTMVRTELTITKHESFCEAYACARNGTVVKWDIMCQRFARYGYKLVSPSAPQDGFVASRTFALEEPVETVSWVHPSNRSATGGFAGADEFDRMDELERQTKRHRAAPLGDAPAIVACSNRLRDELMRTLSRDARIEAATPREMAAAMLDDAAAAAVDVTARALAQMGAAPQLSFALPHLSHAALARQLAPLAADVRLGGGPVEPLALDAMSPAPAVLSMAGQRVAAAPGALSDGDQQPAPPLNDELASFLLVLENHPLLRE